MTQLTPQQEKRVNRIADIMEQGNLAVAAYLFEMEDKFQETVDSIKSDFALKVKELKDSVPDLEKVLKAVKGKPGDKGDMPVAGVDYPIPENGIDGDNYILTDQDKKDIARSIKVPIVDRIIERTDIIHEQPIVKTEIVKEVLKEIVTDETGEDIVSKINALPIEPDKQIGIKHIKDLEQALTKIGSRRTLFYGRNSSTSTSSGGFTALTATGTIDDSNVTFTFASAPTYVVINGVWRKSGEGWSGTTTVTLTAPCGSGGSIWGVS